MTWKLLDQRVNEGNLHPRSLWCCEPTCKSSSSTSNKVSMGKGRKEHICKALAVYTSLPQLKSLNSESFEKLLSPKGRAQDRMRADKNISSYSPSSSLLLLCPQYQNRQGTHTIKIHPLLKPALRLPASRLGATDTCWWFPMQQRSVIVARVSWDNVLQNKENINLQLEAPRSLISNFAKHPARWHRSPFEPRSPSCSLFDWEFVHNLGISKIR